MMAARQTHGTGALDRAKVELVTKLLGKAARTDYEPEALALVERSYSLLAEIITFSDQATSGGADRRRERRLLRDRRRSRRADPAGPAGPVRAGSADEGVALYRRIAESTGPDDGPGALRKLL